MSLEQFVEEFEESVGDIEPGSLSGAAKFRELDVWDSLAVLNVIAMVDAEYNVRLKAAKLKEYETLEALYDEVRTRSKA